MKQPKDKIYRLIQSMSPAEKRYFKRHYASRQSNLTQLFDFINQMSTYDEDLVKKEFSGSKLAQNLKVYKVQLLDLVLKSLVSYHSKNNPKSQIRMGLEEVDILMEKQLYKHAKNRLKKVKSVCLKYEEYTYLIEIGYKEIQLEYTHTDRIGMSKNPIWEELKGSLNKLKEQVNLSLLSSQVLDYRKSFNPNDPPIGLQSYVDEILAMDLIHKTPGQLSFRSNLSKNTILSSIYFFSKDMEKEAAIKKDNVSIFDQNAHFKSYLTFEYLAVLLNYTNLCLEGKQYDQVDYLISQARQFAGNNGIFKRPLVYFHYAAVKASFERKKWKAIVNEGIENEVIKFLNLHQIEKERIALLIYCYLSLTYMALEKPKKVQAYIRLMHQCHPESRAYFEELIQVIELILHYETRDEIILANLINSIQRRGKSPKSNQDEDFFAALLRLFNKLIRAPGRHAEVAKSFKAEMSRYKEDKLFYLFTYIKLDCWLEAIIKKRSFAEQIKKA